MDILRDYLKQLERRKKNKKYISKPKVKKSTSMFGGMSELQSKKKK